MARDRSGRTLNYLRVSLTDACNLRCLYCMPEEISFRPARQLLTNEELSRLLRLFASLGFEKIRFTGGEPTLRDNLAGLIQNTRAIPGVREVLLTTNGAHLKQLARPLVHAGLQRINISLNTLDPGRFTFITRGGSFDKTWEGILEAEREGLSIKLNAVILKGINDRQDPAALARLTLEHPWQIRFIELMPLGDVAEFQRHGTVNEHAVFQQIQQALGPLVPLNGHNGNSMARLYRLSGAAGTIGFISPYSHPFCGQCSRARLTADGKLRLCLLQETEMDLMTPLRTGATDDALKTIMVEALQAKPDGHRLHEQHAPPNRGMSEIGG
ncbi:MAG: GTP 3',8-cyclase MoaA [Lentisphaerota bacterium]